MAIFKQFLIERAESMASDNLLKMAYLKIIDNVDDGHVNVTDKYYSFNLGNIIGQSTYDDIDVRIQLNDGRYNNDVKLGEIKGKYTIVIFVGKLPKRQEIDTLLSDNKNILNGFIREFKKFKSLNLTDSKNTDKKYRSEKENALFDRSELENNYNKFASDIRAKVEEYNKTKQELESQKETVASDFKKASIELAITNLKKDMIGTNYKEFIKKMSKLESGDFMNYLDKDMVKKLKHRLESLYNSI